MAFLRNRIEKVNSFGAATMEAVELSAWFYATADTIAQVSAANYFDGMIGHGMAVGDYIACRCSDGAVELKVATNTGVHITTTKGGAAGGQATTVAAIDTIVTGLGHLTSVTATLNDAPVAGCQFVTADLGDQAGAPAAGSFYLKTWKATAAGDTTQIAATTFGKKVSWAARGY